MTAFASDRDAAGIRGVPKKRSQAQHRRDVLRAARRNTQALADGRADRRFAWPEGQPDFAAARQEARLRELESAKRGLRRDVYRERPDLEGRDFRGRTGSAGRGR